MLFHLFLSFFFSIFFLESVNFKAASLLHLHPSAEHTILCVVVQCLRLPLPYTFLLQPHKGSTNYLLCSFALYMNTLFHYYLSFPLKCRRRKEERVCRDVVCLVRMNVPRVGRIRDAYMMQQKRQNIFHSNFNKQTFDIFQEHHHCHHQPSQSSVCVV